MLLRHLLPPPALAHPTPSPGAASRACRSRAGRVGARGGALGGRLPGSLPPGAAQVCWPDWQPGWVTGSVWGLGRVHQQTMEAACPRPRPCPLVTRPLFPAPGCADIDHNFWGRPQEQPVGGDKRPVYVWNYTQPAADLLGTVRGPLREGGRHLLLHAVAGRLSAGGCTACGCMAVNSRDRQLSRA